MHYNLMTGLYGFIPFRLILLLRPWPYSLYCVIPSVNGHQTFCNISQVLHRSSHEEIFNYQVSLSIITRRKQLFFARKLKVSQTVQIFTLTWWLLNMLQGEGGENCSCRFGRGDNPSFLGLFHSQSKNGLNSRNTCKRGDGANERTISCHFNFHYSV